MAPILIHTRRFPPRNYHAITLFPFVFYNGNTMDEREVRHEMVHMWQQTALLVIFFYLFYLAFWLINIVRYRNLYRAYQEIPFERSAYMLENKSDVPVLQQSFHWLRCL